MAKTTAKSLPWINHATPETVVEVLNAVVDATREAGISARHPSRGSDTEGVYRITLDGEDYDVPGAWTVQDDLAAHFAQGPYLVLRRQCVDGKPPILHAVSEAWFHAQIEGAGVEPVAVLAQVDPDGTCKPLPLVQIKAMATSVRLAVRR